MRYVRLAENEALLRSTVLDYAEQCEALSRQLSKVAVLEYPDCFEDGSPKPRQDPRLTEAQTRLTLLAHGMRNLARDLA